MANQLNNPLSMPLNHKLTLAHHITPQNHPYYEKKMGYSGKVVD